MSPVTHSSLLVSSITALLLLAQAPLSVNAHIKMITPPPLRGENNPQYDWSSYDYSMTNPLLEDGSNFACKGYQSDVPGKSHAVATVKAGQQFEVALDGSATHGGGSCQFSLSYDNGQTFGVVHSVIGGCPLEKKYSFKIPSNVPAGKDVLLAWTWFNKVGNREMYMNCAAINIESSSTSSIQLPSVFRANTFGGSCHTVEGDELVFPNPGASVVYGGKWAGQKPGKDALQLNGCSSDQISDKFVTLKSNTGASSPGYGNGNDGGEGKPEPTIDEPVKTAAPTVEPPVVVVPSSSVSSIKASLAPIRGGAAKTQTVTSSSQAATSSTATVSTSSSASASVSPSSSAKLASSRGGATTKASSAPVTGETPGFLCTGNGLKCSEDGGSFSVCADGRWVSMGLVAPGTTCKNGKIGFANIAAPDSCTPGSLKCSNDGKSFSVCNTDGESYTSMGLVAPGTICQNGKIAAASTKRSMNKARNAKRHGPRRLSHSS